MKNYLITAEISDGEHEHRSFGIIRAKDTEKAWKIAEKNLDEYFLWGDGLARAKLRKAEPITKKEADLIDKLGLAYYMN